MAPQVHDDRYLAEAAREMIASFQAQRFQHVVALFDQLQQRQAGMAPSELLAQLETAGGRNITAVVTRSYAYDSCWFCEAGMARCETCDGTGQVDEDLNCVECYALGKVRCTVCRGSSFVIVDELPEFFRLKVVRERLKLVERAFDDVTKKYEALTNSGKGTAGFVRRIHHQNQQVLGVLHDCHGHVSKSGDQALIAKFNSMVRDVQNRYCELTIKSVRASLESARRFLSGGHGKAESPPNFKLDRSVAHQLAIARGYIEILNRQGKQAESRELEYEIQDIERELQPEEARHMVVPVGPQAETPPPPSTPVPPRPEPSSPAVTEFTENLSDAQIEEVWLMMREDYWTRERTLEEVRQTVRASNVNIAMIRREGKKKRVVGYVRAMSDGVFKASVYDFVIAKDFRGAGLGRLLMSRLMSNPLITKIRDVEIASLPEAVRMFKQWGFSESVDGLVLLRYMRRR